MDPNHPASGGLASALGDMVRHIPTTWVAVGDAAAGMSPGGAFVEPVHLTPHERQLFYGGFSNRFYWMLAHGILHPPGAVQLRHWFDEGYRPANEHFVEAIEATLDGGAGEREAPVWVHDYHLFLVPSMLRSRRPKTRIGFFLHVPWPSLAAWHEVPYAPVPALVRGLLGADVIGLQTVRDAHRLLASIEEFAPEAEVTWARVGRRSDRGDGPVAVGTVAAGGHRAEVYAFPISIDPRAVTARAHSARAERWRHQLAGEGGVRTLVRVDRLDPAKNTLLGFEAYEHLLERRPDLHGRTRFLAFLVPSRESLPEYREYRLKVLAAAKRINERFTLPGGAEPVTLFLQNNMEAALAGLSLADVVLINSLADGMNLVAKEMTMVGSEDAVLVLSRTAGVAEAYRDAAILVDPEDLEATADALERALDMAPGERVQRMAMMRQAVTSWTLSDWLTSQLALLFRRTWTASVAEPPRSEVTWPGARA
jgi:trehalose 6-phosphate synthase